MIDHLTDMVGKQQEYQKKLGGTENTVVEMVSKLRDEIKNQVMALERKMQEKKKDQRATNEKSEDVKKSKAHPKAAEGKVEHGINRGVSNDYESNEETQANKGNLQMLSEEQIREKMQQQQQQLNMLAQLGFPQQVNLQKPNNPQIGNIQPTINPTQYMQAPQMDADAFNSLIDQYNNQLLQMTNPSKAQEKLSQGSVDSTRSGNLTQKKQELQPIQESKSKPPGLTEDLSEGSTKIEKFQPYDQTQSLDAEAPFNLEDSFRLLAQLNPNLDPSGKPQQRFGSQQ